MQQESGAVYNAVKHKTKILVTETWQSLNKEQGAVPTAEGSD